MEEKDKGENTEVITDSGKGPKKKPESSVDPLSANPPRKREVQTTQSELNVSTSLPRSVPPCTSSKRASCDTVDTRDGKPQNSEFVEETKKMIQLKVSASKQSLSKKQFENEALPEVTETEKKSMERLFVTISNFLLVSNVAITLGCAGPVLSNIKIQTQSSITRVTQYFTYRSSVSLICGVMMGPIFERYDCLALMGAASLISSFFLMTCLLFEEINIFLGFSAVTGLSATASSMGSMLSIGALWKEKSHPLYAMLNLSFSIFLMLGPALSKPFLTNTVHGENTNVSRIVTFTPDDTDVEYLFVILGVYTFICGMFSLVVFYTFNGKIKKPKTDHSESNFDIYKWEHFLPCIMFFIMLFSYAGIEITFPGLLPYFLEHYFKWTVLKASNVSLAFQGANVFATFCCIFISRRLKAETISFINSVVCATSLALFGVYATKANEYAIWVFTVSLGLGYGTFIPSSFAWAEYNGLKGGIFSAVYWTGFNTGSLVLPLIGGTIAESNNFMYIKVMWLSCALGLLFSCLAFKLHTIINNFSKVAKYPTSVIEIKNTNWDAVID